MHDSGDLEIHATTETPGGRGHESRSCDTESFVSRSSVTECMIRETWKFESVAIQRELRLVSSIYREFRLAVMSHGDSRYTETSLYRETWKCMRLDSRYREKIQRSLYRETWKCIRIQDTRYREIQDTERFKIRVTGAADRCDSSCEFA